MRTSPQLIDTDSPLKLNPKSRIQGNNIARLIISLSISTSSAITAVQIELVDSILELVDIGVERNRNLFVISHLKSCRVHSINGQIEGPANCVV